jgi:lysozyme family protein
MTVLIKAICGSVLVAQTLLAYGATVVCDATPQFVDHNMVDYTVNTGAMRGVVIDTDAQSVPRAF